MSVLTDTRCPRCGRALPAGTTAQGLCPTCLFAAALSTGEPDAEASPDSASLPYRVLTPIDRDGDGVTYLAQTITGFTRYVALKIVGPRDDASAILDRFEKWKPALACVQHPSVGTVLDVGSAGSGHVYVASEYAAGRSWASVTARASFGLPERLQVSRQLVDALDAAHRHGVPHMKLDTSSVKIATAGVLQAKILGFGYALIVEGAHAAPEVDLSAIGRIIRELGVQLPRRSYPTAATIREAVNAL